FQCWMFSVSPGVEVTNLNAFPGKALRPKFGYFQKLNAPGVLGRKFRIGRGHWSDETKLRRADNLLNTHVRPQPFQTFPRYRAQHYAKIGEGQDIRCSSGPTRARS